MTINNTPVDLLEDIKKDIVRLVSGITDANDIISIMIDNNKSNLKRMEGTTTLWTYHSTAWVERKLEDLNIHHADRFFEMLVEMYKLGYKLIYINDAGFSKGHLYFKAQDYAGHTYTGFANPTGNLTLSIMTLRKERRPSFSKVLTILYYGKKPLVKHTIIQALLELGGFMKGGK